MSCKSCSPCKSAAILPDPVPLKEHTMVYSRHGVLIYGGGNWFETNLMAADIVNLEREKFISRCKPVMEERTAIEQSW